MSKEVFVSFEVAKLLKEKGFDWECSTYLYTINVYNYGDEPCRFQINDSKNSELASDKMTAPTQQMACKWLREVHKIDISVTPDDGSWWIKVTELESWSGVFNGKVLNSDDIKYAYKGDTSTKESCYEAALQYVLTKLI